MARMPRHPLLLVLMENRRRRRLIDDMTISVAL